MKQDFRNICIILSFIIIPVSGVIAQTVTWDVTGMFGVTSENAKPGTDAAILAARSHFETHPDDTLILYYPSGTYSFFGADHAINLGNEFISGDNGRLVFLGGGYENTVFITKDRTMNDIWGRDVYRVLFKGIHFARDYCTVIQGTVDSVSEGEVILDLHDDFPTPDSLWQYGITGGWGLYFRRYTDDPDDPHIITEDNAQIAWDKTGTYCISGRKWRFALVQSTMPPYSRGDVIGVKLKHGGQTYWLCGGDDIEFSHCKWTQKTRGVLRCGISNITFRDCLIDQGPRIGGRTPCLASPGGGPQCGQPDDAIIHNVLVENCTIMSTGDDNVAFFNVDGGIVRNCCLKDGFARGILLYQVSNICLEDNTYIRCEPLWTGGETESNCILYSEVKQMYFQDFDVKVYPNPVEDRLYIQSDKLSPGLVASIYNLSGRKVISNRSLSLDGSIEFCDIGSGLYILELRDKFNCSYRKVLKL
jgi:hypothetical protein